MTDASALRRTLTTLLMALGMAAALPTQAQQLQPPPTLQADLRKARDEARKADEQLKKARELQLANCQASEAAARLLQDSKVDTRAEITPLAQQAQQLHLRCEASVKEVERLQTDLAAQRAVLRSLALQLAGLAPTPVAAAPKPAPTPEQTKTLIDQAAKAQEGMDKLRKQTATVFDIGDGATATALAQNYSAFDVKDDSLRESLVEWAGDAQKLPGMVRTAVFKAQRAANQLVDETLKLKACPPDAVDCARKHHDAATDAQEALKTASDKATADFKTLQYAGFALASADALKDRVKDLKTEAFKQTLNQQITLRQLLDSNPNVSSFFGGDAVGLSAGSADSSSTIRLVKEAKTLLGNNRYSLIASTPTSDRGRSQLLDSIDKIKNKTSLQLVVQNINPAFTAGDLKWINDFAFGLGLARSKHSYLAKDDKTGELASASGYYNTFSLGARWAFLSKLTSDKPNLLILSAARQRYYQDSDDDGIHCADIVVKPDQPTAVKCMQGLMGAPRLDYNTLLGIEYRIQWKKLDMALNLKHSSKKRYELDIPVYLIGNLDDKDNPSALTGGVSLNRSQGVPGVRWSVFVSAPLSFGKVGRPELNAP